MHQHPVVHGVNILRLDADVAVHHQMQVRPIVRTLAQGDIMRSAISHVLARRHIPQFIGPELRSQSRFLLRNLRLAVVRFGIVQQIDLPQVLHPQQFLHKRQHLLFPCRTI